MTKAQQRMYWALKRAIKKVGGPAAFSRIFNAVSPQRVNYWLHEGFKLPSEFVLRAEEMTGVSRHELRPDVFGEA